MNTDFIKISIEISQEMLNNKDSLDVPVVATIVNYKTLQYRSFSNAVYKDFDPTAHAEIIAIREMCKENKSTYLNDYDLYVTLEPCVMCAAAISYAKIRRVYFGAYDVKSGGVIHGPKVFESSSIHHKPEVIGGVHEKMCEIYITDFFKKLRHKP